jgi:hypothetical protein
VTAGQIRRLLVAILAALVAVSTVSACGSTTRPAAQASKRFFVGAQDPSQYRSIFGDTPSRNRLREAQGAFENARSRAYVLSQPSTPTFAADTFLGQYEALPSGESALVIAHNSGGNLLFPDGSQLPINALNRTDVTFAVIACKSDGYVSGSAVGVPIEIGYEVAFATADKYSDYTARAIAIGGSLNPQEARTLLLQANQEAVSETQRRRGVVVTVRVFAAGGTIGVFIYVRVDR